MEKRHNWKIAIGLYITVAAVSLALIVYRNVVLVPQVSHTFLITPLNQIIHVAVRPVFWICVGALIPFLLFSITTTTPMLSTGVRRVCMGGFLVFVLAYAGLFLLTRVADLSNHRFMINLVIWTLQNTAIFLFPGLMLGVCTAVQRKA